MYCTIKEFADHWTHESNWTQKVLSALTDKSLAQAVIDGHRTAGRIAWHITTSLAEMGARMGIDFGGFNCEAPVPRSAEEIASTYERLSKTLVDGVRTSWNDQTLSTEVDMYGERWTRAFGLKVCIDHQIHHRGQLTVLMRQAGLRVPSIYGPAKEDWSQMAMEPPTI